MSEIDKEELVNLSACTQYAKDIFSYLKIRQSAVLRNNSTNTKREFIYIHRDKVIDWLVTTQGKLALADETLYIAVSIFDRFVLKTNPAQSKLPLLGLVALLIATKYEEVQAPTLRHFLCHFEERVVSKEVHKMELEVLQALDFDISVPSVLQFLDRYRKYFDCDERKFTLAMYICEAQLLSKILSEFEPSLIAVGGLYLAEKAVEKDGRFEFEEELVRELGHSKDEVMECAEEMLKNMLVKERIMLSSIRKKYAKYKDIVRIPLDSIKVN